MVQEDMVVVVVVTLGQEWCTAVSFMLQAQRERTPIHMQVK